MPQLMIFNSKKSLVMMILTRVIPVKTSLYFATFQRAEQSNVFSKYCASHSSNFFSKNMQLLYGKARSKNILTDKIYDLRR